MQTKHVSEFLRYMTRNRCSPQSVASYESTLRIVQTKLPKINDRTVEDFLLSRYDNQATRNKVLGQIKSFAKWAVARKIDGVDLVTLRNFQKPRTIPKVITDSDTEKFIKALEHIDIQAWAVAVLMRTTAMRIGEVFERIDRSSRYEKSGRGFLKFFGKGNKERIVPLTKDAEEAFRIWTRPGYRWSVRTIRRRFVAAEKMARIKHLKPHWFRHTIATKAVSKGHSFTQISYLMGNTEAVCQNVYGRTNEKQLADVVDDALRAVVG